jgi:hypothetical protein
VRAVGAVRAVAAVPAEVVRGPEPVVAVAPGLAAEVGLEPEPVRAPGQVRGLEPARGLALELARAPEPGLEGLEPVPVALGQAREQVRGPALEGLELVPGPAAARAPAVEPGQEPAPASVRLAAQVLGPGPVVLEEPAERPEPPEARRETLARPGLAMARVAVPEPRAVPQRAVVRPLVVARPRAAAGRERPAAREPGRPEHRAVPVATRVRARRAQAATREEPERPGRRRGSDRGIVAPWWGRRPLQRRRPRSVSNSSSPPWIWPGPM